MINRATLVGRLTKDPEYRVTPSGVAVATFTLAINRTFTNANGEREANFINCVVFRRQAENVNKFLFKGYANGGKLNTSNAEEVTEKYIEKEVKKEKSKQEVLPTGWKKNKHKTYYKAQKGSFINGNQPIQARYVGPFRLRNNEAGDLPPNTKIEYNEVMLQDKHVWVGYDSYEDERIYLPVGTWNGKKPPKNKIKQVWGTLK